MKLFTLYSSTYIHHTHSFTHSSYNLQILLHLILEESWNFDPVGAGHKDNIASILTVVSYVSIVLYVLYTRQGFGRFLGTHPRHI